MVVFSPPQTKNSGQENNLNLHGGKTSKWRSIFLLVKNGPIFLLGILIIGFHGSRRLHLMTL